MEKFAQGSWVGVEVLNVPANRQKAYDAYFKGARLTVNGNFFTFMRRTGEKSYGPVKILSEGKGTYQVSFLKRRIRLRAASQDEMTWSESGAKFAIRFKRAK